MMYQRGLGLLDLALCVDTEVKSLLTPNVCQLVHVYHIGIAGRGTQVGEGEDDAGQNGEDARPR